MGEARSLPTDYAGIRFRSRTEARWAVFFDALRLRWEYEPEGYRLADGTCYLPDFSVSAGDGRSWVEVKGAQPTPEETARVILLARGTSVAGLLVEGAPHPDWPVWRVTPDGGVRRTGLAEEFAGDVVGASHSARASFTGRTVGREQADAKVNALRTLETTETDLISILLSCPTLVPRCVADDALALVRGERRRWLVERCVAHYDEWTGTWHDVSAFLGEIDDLRVRDFVARALNDKPTVAAAESVAAYGQCIERLREFDARERRLAVGAQLPRNGELTPEILALLREKQRLRDETQPCPTWEG